MRVNVRKHGRRMAEHARTDAPTVLRYGTATASNEVDGIPMEAVWALAVDKVAYLQAGGDRLILADSGAWRDITLASGDWTQTLTPQWRHNGGRIELRGFLTRINTSFGAGGTLFSLGSANPPNPGYSYRLISGVVLAALTPDATSMYWLVESGTALFRSTSAGHNIAIGDRVSLDGIWWPA